MEAEMCNFPSTGAPITGTDERKMAGYPRHHPPQNSSGCKIAYRNRRGLRPSGLHLPRDPPPYVWNERAAAPR